MSLAPYAVTEENSRGRQHPIEIARDRTAFRRDYTRILHSQAFRRLQGKTQVFSVTSGDDRFRTRMSHSLEVEQVASSLCARLNLNADLAAVLAIAHDIGHAPFGHLGQDVLDGLMAPHGGFEHNLQALRLVDHLESPYVDHRGLNLMFETREGLLKHCTPERAKKLGDVGRRHLVNGSPPLEVQAVDVADAIAYCHADLEDAFVMGVLSVEDLLEAPGYQEAWNSYAHRTFGNQKTPNQSHPTSEHFKGTSPSTQRSAKAIIFAVIREMTSIAIDDVAVATRLRLESAGLTSLDDVRRSPPLVDFSEAAKTMHLALKAYSRERIYYHERIVSERAKERVVLEELFRAYVADPSEMSGQGSEMEEGLHRAVADHLAGMTDRFACLEHERIKKMRPELLELKGPHDAAAVRRPRTP